MKRFVVGSALVASGLLVLAVLAPREGKTEPNLEAGTRAQTLPGLIEPVQLRRDFHNVPHIFAGTDRDALFVLGYVHAQDRFFQMDLLRRTFSGTLAELVGPATLPQDIQLRTLGLRRAAEASLPAYSATTRAWLDGYVRGVNAYIFDPANPLPPEYGALELTRESIPPWTAVDSLVIGKGLAFGLSFDLGDIDRTLTLVAFQIAGALGDFNGLALFFEDLYRSSPFDPSVSIPGAVAAGAEGTRAQAPIPVQLPDYLTAESLALARGYRARLEEAPALRFALRLQTPARGSNWWVASGAVTESGHPLLANDPHLGLDTPAIFYQAQLRIRQGRRPAMNVFGVSFPGIPGIVLGCNTRICWGATTNPMDVTDVYLERLVIDPATGLPTHTIFEGNPEPIVILPQTFRVNQIGDGQLNNLADGGVGPLQGGLTLIVPRRNHGPIVAVDVSDPANPMALSVQYTGWGQTRELETFRIWARAGDLDEFVRGLQFFDFGSQNWAYADIHGNIAYFTSGEMPLREDLQTLNAPDGGIPPFFIRDGTHTRRHEWLPVANRQPGQSLPFEILPFTEMPQVVNPPEGFILNANNDPLGTTVDNNPLNQLRPGGGLFYLSPGYAPGLRMGRIRQLFEAELAADGTFSVADFQRIQANHQLLDAQVLVPHVLNAFQNATSPDAPPPLANLGADPRIAEAVDRLAAWDFSTPTGILEGHDPGDDPAILPDPSPTEGAHSVAATIYSVWRGQAVQQVIDGTLDRLGLGSFAPGSSLAMSALRHHLDRFPAAQGVGASGVPFFVAPGATSPAEARDRILLESLARALDLLASDAFAPAFNQSNNQDDYRWGRLHRIVFDHPLGGPFNIPPGGGIGDLGPGLPGIPRSGGFGAVDASSHSARADGVNEFMFGSGPARRFVGEMAPTGPEVLEVIPGGQSGLPGSPFQADQLRLWLTNRYDPWHYRPDDVVQNTMTLEILLPER